MPSVARTAWASIRTNVVPMAALWAVAAVAVVAYYASPPFAALFEPLSRWQCEGGKFAAFLNRAFFVGILPGVFLVSVKAIRPRRPFLTVLAYIAWGGAWGMMDDVFFTFLERMFGGGRDFGTLVAKTAFTQVVYTLMIGLVPGTVFFMWVARDFSVARVRREWPRRFFRDACLSLLLANWFVWIPVNICTFAFPLPLQIQLVGLAGSFWMLVGLQAGMRQGGR